MKNFLSRGLVISIIFLMPSMILFPHSSELHLDNWFTISGIFFFCSLDSLCLPSSTGSFKNWETSSPASGFSPSPMNGLLSFETVNLSKLELVSKPSPALGILSLNSPVESKESHSLPTMSLSKCKVSTSME